MGKFLVKIIHALSRLIIAAGKINLVKALRNYRKDADLIVLIYNPGKYKLTELPIDLVLLSCIVNLGRKFRIQWSLNIADISGKTLFLNLSDKYSDHRQSNYVDSLIKLVKRLESQGNRVFYSSYEIQFWENKARMHQLFQELGIRCPTTRLNNLSEPIPFSTFNFPLLVKDEHSSGSRGVYKINNSDELESLCQNEKFRQKNTTLVTQELLNIHRDLRVILVKGEILLHYWRTNPSKEWKPTSTKHGSAVDFLFFPEKWRAYIIDQFNKLNLVTGAFDIAWQNDDLETEPFILEVSPSYDPNPKVDLNGTGLSYGQWKNKIRWKKNFDALYIDIVHRIKQRYVSACLAKR